jgi:uncharacterized membrane protein
MAFRVLAALAVICALAAIVLFSLGGFASVLAIELAVVFALGALIARSRKPSGRAA